MLRRISILLSAVGAAALLLGSDLVIWHILPKRFDIVEMLAFWSGAALSLLAVALAVASMIMDGKSRPGIYACTWSAVEFLGFGLVYLYGILSG
jgi:hypothetical protein